MRICPIGAVPCPCRIDLSVELLTCVTTFIKPDHIFFGQGPVWSTIPQSRFRGEHAENQIATMFPGSSRDEHRLSHQHVLAGLDRIYEHCLATTLWNNGRVRCNVNQSEKKTGKAAIRSKVWKGGVCLLVGITPGEQFRNSWLIESNSRPHPSRLHCPLHLHRDQFRTDAD